MYTNINIIIIIYNIDIFIYKYINIYVYKYSYFAGRGRYEMSRDVYTYTAFPIYTPLIYIANYEQDSSALVINYDE